MWGMVTYGFGRHSREEYDAYDYGEHDKTRQKSVHSLVSGFRRLQ